MKYFTPNPSRRNVRAFLASLLSYLLLVGQFAPLAHAWSGNAAARSAPAEVAGAARAGAGEVSKLSAAGEPAAAPLALAAAVTASKADSFSDPEMDGIEPGGTISYEVTVANGGPDAATGVTFTDTISPYTTLTGSVTMSPLARPDTYVATKDTQLVVSAGSGVLTNDSGLPPPTATAIPAGPTTQGGTVTLNTNGGFTYDPPSGFVGTDTFTYTATNSNLPNDTALVTINVDAAPTVSSTTPVNGATSVAADANITVTFSESVNATLSSFTVECPTGSPQTYALSSSPATTFTLNPSANLPVGAVCTVTVVAAQITDADSNDPPDLMAADHVFSFTVDSPPTVSTTVPTNGATGVTTNANITINFSESVNATTSSFQIECPAASGARAFTIGASPSASFTLNPTLDLPAGVVCTVTVIAAQITDADSGDPPDNMVSNHVFTFTTDAAPAVTTTSPVNGATDLPVNTNITVNFTETVNVTASAFTLQCPTPTAIPFTLTPAPPGGANSFTLDPNANLPAGVTCTVTVVANQVTDTDGDDPPDNMAGNHVFTFTTDAAPSVTATSPVNNATQVANNANVTITFSEPVAVAGEWFSFNCATSGVLGTSAFTVTPNGTNTVFTLDRTSDYANGELCTVTVFAAQVTDADSNDPPDNMAANHMFAFTVDSPPTVLTTVPTNGAINIAATTNITVNFSEPVNATTSSFKIECPTPGNLQTFTLSSSPAASFTLDPNANLPIGVICTVTVVAAQITDQDSGDPPDGLSPGDYVFSFSIPPDAVNDSRNATGNIQIVTTGRSNFSVLANDIFPVANPVTVTAFDATSARGGQVSVVAGTGTFSYNPPAGYQGADSFNYTITNLAGSDTATVNITVAGILWFVDDTAPACITNNNTCGRLTDPFSTLAAFEAANGNATPTNNGDIIAPQASEHVFIYSGNYIAPLTLEAGQRVIGEGATSTLQTLSGVTPVTDSDSLPATGGTKPSITSAGNGFNLVANNQLYGLAFGNTVGTAINSNANVGTLIIGDVTINNLLAGAGIVLDDGGTSVTTTGLNTISTTTGTALNITNTTIGAADVTFRSISSNGGGVGSNGIVLNNTGSTGNLAVTANGSTCSTALNCTGGAIQNKTIAISLTGTNSPSFDRMFIQNTTSSGISGTEVANFSLTNSVVSNTGTSATADIANTAIFFAKQSAGNEQNLTGTVTITGNTLSNMYWHGISIFNYRGTISSANISNNAVTSPATMATSKGTGIQIQALGTPAAGAASITTATINLNTVTGFPSDAGMMVQCGNATETGTASTCGSSAASQINITNNTLTGQPFGTQGLLLNANGVATANYNVTGNNISNTVGNALSHNVFGDALVNTTISNNTVDPNHTSAILTGGIAGGTGAATAFVSNTAVLNVKVANNIVTDIDGSGIRFVMVDNTTATMNITVRDNNVEAPSGSVTPGIVVRQNNDDGNVTTCLDISGNTSAGNPAAQTGIGVRRASSAPGAPDLFGIEGLPSPPANAPQTAAYITSQNPLSVGGAIVQSGSNFTACSSAPAAPVSLTSTSTRTLQPTATLRASRPSGTTTTLVEEPPQPGLDRVPDPVITEKAISDAGTTPQTWGDAAPELKNSAPRADAPQPSLFRKAAYTAAPATSPAREVTRGSAAAARANASRTSSGWKAPAASASSASAYAEPSAASGEQVNVTIGDMPSGKSVKIRFQVTVDTPFTGPTQEVSNQGTVSGTNISNVLTDDLTVMGANNPTVTPVAVPPNITVHGAKVAEPGSGSIDMVFTVSLSLASGQTVTVGATTAPDPVGANPATVGTDYTHTFAGLTFLPGERIKTVNVPVLADGTGGEPDETFLVKLSGANNGIIAGTGEATGTITAANPAGTVQITELRTSGPGGPRDEFVEVYNNSNSALNTGATGWVLVASNNGCTADPVVVGVIPPMTSIPARGHYLFTGPAAQYSLANYGGPGLAAGDATLSADLGNDVNVGLFETNTLVNISSLNRRDAVGFGLNTGGICNLLREGSTLPAASGSATQHSFVRTVTLVAADVPTPTDTNTNAADFYVISTTATTAPVSAAITAPTLGAPGPENRDNPRIKKFSQIGAHQLDTTKLATASPNRVRKTCAQSPEECQLHRSQLGTLSFRRVYQNNTGGNVTQLRFRIYMLTTYPPPAATADLRALTSGPTSAVVTGVGTVTVNGTTVEAVPAQTLADPGGGLNSSFGVASGVVSTGTPLPNGGTVAVQFLFGVQQGGSFNFLVHLEALP